MLFSNPNRTLLQGMLACGVVVASATACSRSDRSESGQVADTAPDAPRAATAPASADTSLQGDSAAAGYRAMERDTLGVPESDSARVTQDTSETSLNAIISDTVAIVSDTRASIADTSWAEIAVAGDTAAQEAEIGDTVVAGYVEMARDTSTTADQIVAGADVSADADVAVADTTGNAGRIRPPEDSTEVPGQVTTDPTTSVAVADTVESERIRPPEDSTELLGNVGEETADEQEITNEQEINANEEAITTGDRETVAAAETPADEVGAAAIGGTVTGDDAVALMTRQGARCQVVDPETNEGVRWDMSSTPVTLNPCGMGSMNLSKVGTAGQRGSGAAGQ